MEEVKKLVYRKALIRHLISMEEGTYKYAGRKGRPRKGQGKALTGLIPLITYYYFFLCLGFCYTSYTQLITEIDAINFVFLLSTFCLLSRLAFVINRINEGVPEKPTNLNSDELIHLA